MILLNYKKYSFILLLGIVFSSCNNSIKKSIQKNTLYYNSLDIAIEVARKDMIEIARLSKLKKNYDTLALLHAQTLPQLISPISVLETDNSENFIGTVFSELFSKKSNKIYFVPFIHNNSIVASTELAYSKNRWQILHNSNPSLLNDFQKMIQLSPEILNPIKVESINHEIYSLTLLPTILMTNINDSFTVYKTYPMLSKNGFKNFNIDSIENASLFFQTEYKKGLKVIANNTNLNIESGYYIYVNGILTLLNKTNNKIQLNDFIKSQINKINLLKNKTTE